MVLVLLLNGVMVMVTRFSTVILCLAAGISILFLVLYWRFCRSSTELRGALFCGGSVIAYLAVLFAVILVWLVREHFAEVSPFVVYLVSIAIVALCSGVSWISVGRKLRELQRLKRAALAEPFHILSLVQYHILLRV